MSMGGGGEYHQFRINNVEDDIGGVAGGDGEFDDPNDGARDGGELDGDQGAEGNQ